MWSFAALCDEFCVSSRLFMKLDLAPSRESLLHFLEQLRRGYPRMTRLRRRDDGTLVLDEESSEAAERRYVRVDPASLRFGFYGAPDAGSYLAFANLILNQAPVHLSFSDLDYDYLEAVFTFELEYRGNHDELVAETLFGDHPLIGALSGGDMRIIDCQPFLGVALGGDCDRQLFMEIKGRTSTFEVRTGEYEANPLSVVVTARQYWGFGSLRDLVAAHRELVRIAERFASERAVPRVVQPLAAAIESRG